ncbi:immunity repressor [Gordonia phage Spooky]|nr:immunity repressor [Gordonia phage Spooky]
MENKWWAYVQQRTTGATQKAISEETGIEQTVLSRWKLGRNRPDAQNVIQFARAMGRPPMEALVAAGYLGSQEVGDVVEVAMSATDLAVDDLIEEMRRRIATAEAQSAFIDALTQGAAVWIGEAPHSPGVSVTREGDRVTANLVLSPNNELRIHPALAARTQGETSDFTQEPAATGSASEANTHEKTGAADRRNNVLDLSRSGQATEVDDAPPPDAFADAARAELEYLTEGKRVELEQTVSTMADEELRKAAADDPLLAKYVRAYHPERAAGWDFK